MKRSAVREVNYPLIIGGVLVENSFFTRPQDFIREVQSRTGPSRSYRG